MFHPLLAERHLNAGSVLAPLVDLLSDRLSCAARFDCASGTRRATFDLAGRGLILVSAVEKAPDCQLRAAAQDALVGNSVPSAAVMFYPEGTLCWRSSPKAYVAWRYDSDVAGVELMGARIALDGDNGVIIMAETGEGLVAGSGGHFFASLACSEPEDRWRAFLVGADAWQGRVVRRVWQEAA